MRTASRSGWGGVAFAAILSVAPARAQDACVLDADAEPRDLQLTPTAGSREEVTLDAPVIARFAGGTDVTQSDAATLLTLFREDDEGERHPVQGRYEREAAQPNVLVFRPEGGLEQEARYVGEVVDPDGREPRALSFLTGTRVDTRPPDFPVRALSLGARASSGACGGVRVDVAFSPADDDGPRGSIEHLVYQTRGAGLEAPVLRQRVRASSSSEVHASFVVGEAEAAVPLCVQVVPVDGVGREGVALPVACFTPAPVPRFVGLCSGGPTPGSGRPSPLVALALLAGALGFRRRVHERSRMRARDASASR